MEQVTKTLNLKINVPNKNDLDSLDKRLKSISQKIDGINSKAKPSAADTRRLNTLREESVELKAQRDELEKITALFDKIGSGKKLSASEQKEATTYLRQQARASRLSQTSSANINTFAKKAIAQEERALLQSQLLKAGFSMADANKYSAKGMSPEDVVAEAAAQKESVGKGITVGINTVTRILSGTNQYVKEIFGVSYSIRDNVKDITAIAAQALNPTSGIASYNTASSLFTNRSARDLQLRYGLSASQAYGFQQASSALGLDTSTLTDYMYMNAKQQEAFTEYMRKYSAWYDKLSSSGALESVQELQLEFAMMKQELSMEFLSWIAENKDAIMSVLRGLLKGLSAILSILPGSSDVSSDLMGVSEGSKYSSYSSSTSNVYINTTNNATGVIQDQSAFEEWFADKSRTLVGQVKSIIGGDE